MLLDVFSLEIVIVYWVIMIVRKGQSKDEEAIAEMHLALALEKKNLALDVEKVRRGVRHLLESPEEGVYYVCEIDEIIAGFIMVFFEWSDWRAGNLYYIDSAYTRPAYRNQHVFSSIFRQAYSDAQSENTSIRSILESPEADQIEALKHLGLSESHYTVLEVRFPQS